jgi:hypothetical protein
MFKSRRAPDLTTAPLSSEVGKNPNVSLVLLA